MDKYEKQVVSVMNTIGKKVKQGEKEGSVKCPFCEGTIRYAYANPMAMIAKCDKCPFKVIA